MVNILALDPGLRRFGALLVQTDGVRHDAFAADVFESEQRIADDDVRLCDDRVRRSRECARWLSWFTRGVDIRLVVAEAMSFPRGAHAIIAMSLAWGVVAAFLDDRGLDLESVAPSYWRSALTGERPKRGGTKAQRKERTARRERMSHAEVVRAIPSIVPLVRRVQPAERQLHVLDAGGVYVWSLRSPGFRRLVA